MLIVSWGRKVEGGGGGGGGGGGDCWGRGGRVVGGGGGEDINKGYIKKGVNKVLKEVEKIGYSLKVEW